MKLLRAFGHPVHQMLSDIPVGLWVLAFTWQWVALSTGSAFWWEMAFWNLLVGVSTALPLALVGFYDFLKIPREQPGKVAAIYHLLSAGTATAFFAGSLLAQAGPNPPEPANTLVVLALSSGGMAFLALGVWYGNELILRYGIGRVAVIPYTGPERRSRPRERIIHGR